MFYRILCVSSRCGAALHCSSGSDSAMPRADCLEVLSISSVICYGCHIAIQPRIVIIASHSFALSPSTRLVLFIFAQYRSYSSFSPIFLLCFSSSLPLHRLLTGIVLVLICQYQFCLITLRSALDLSLFLNDFLIFSLFFSSFCF